MVIKHYVYDGMLPPGLLPTPFVCWHEKEQKEREGERVAVSSNRADTFLAYSSTLRFCRAIVGIEDSGPRNRDIKERRNG